MNIRACKAKLRIKEVPSFEAPRLFGESKLKAIYDGGRILKTIVRERLTPSARLYLAFSAADNEKQPVLQSSNNAF